MNNSGSQFLVAFTVSLLAGLSTMVGAVLIIFDTFKKTKYSMLAYANSFAAGVMAFVAMCEILQVKAVNAFEKAMAKYPKYDSHALTLSYLFFFIGCIICYVFNKIVDYCLVKSNLLNLDDLGKDGDIEIQADDKGEGGPVLDRANICKMSINTMVALTLHNIPEGIITFIETYKEKKFGFVLASAIALHNIPEGIAIAIPIYYATGSKIQVILYTFIASIAEPIGGLIGYCMVSNTQSEWFHGISFGIVSGMMMWIVVFEMLPISLKYSPNKFRVSLLFFMGCFVMAASLAGLSYVPVRTK